MINKLVSISKQIFQTKPILTQKNPTLRLDSDCYKLYKVFDDKNNQENAFIDIISLEKNQRIKGIQLSGFKGSLPKKKNFSSTLTLSFDSTDMSFYLHFTFKDKGFKEKTKLSLNYDENQTLGMDFGITEFGTLSDGTVVGDKQGKILSQLNKKSEQLLAKIQKSSLLGYFGVELKNKENRRNHANNCFNHNFRKQNINLKYRKQQNKNNRRLYNLKYTQVKELLDYCQLNNITQLVLENLNFKKLSLKVKNKSLNQNINLIKNCFSLLEKQIEKNNLNITLSYVNPAYTSQSCPACCFVDKDNRSKNNKDRFRCQYCGFTPQQDERFIKAKLAFPNLSEADYVAALNIKAFYFQEDLKDSLFLKKDKVKELILNLHENKKEVICKDQFGSSVG